MNNSLPAMDPMQRLPAERRRRCSDSCQPLERLLNFSLVSGVRRVARTQEARRTEILRRTRCGQEFGIEELAELWRRGVWVGGARQIWSSAAARGRRRRRAGWARVCRVR